MSYEHDPYSADMPGLDDESYWDAVCSDDRALVESSQRAGLDVRQANPDTEESPDGGDWRERIRLTPASAFRIKAVKWAWESRLPLGEIALIAGREGVGKSTFLAWLASMVTNGNLPGIYHGQPRAILYAASEDSWSYTIAPRMRAAGANLDLVFRIDVVGGEGLILPRDCNAIPDIAEETKAAMLMCDPIVSLVDETINAYKAQEVRRALEPLRRAAERAQLSVPALVHFNKGQGTDAGTLVAGSRAWMEVCRAALAIARDKEADEYTCVVSQIKNNLGRNDLPNMAYTIDSAAVETDDGGETNVGRVRWLEDDYDRSAEDILGDGMSRISTEGIGKGETSTQIALWVSERYRQTGQSVGTPEIISHFADVKPDTVRQNLRRLVKASILVSPIRSMYAPQAAS